MAGRDSALRCPTPQRGVSTTCAANNISARHSPGTCRSGWRWSLCSKSSGFIFSWPHKGAKRTKPALRFPPALFCFVPSVHFCGYLISS
jgi:hypothetical protein